ncbi:hypothetical protein AK6_09875, partial [Stutzerimonas stutzeri]
MSPKLYLVLVLLALGAYLFWLTREQLAAMQTKKKVLRGLWGKSELTVREAGKLAVAKHTLHLSLLSPCILLILPRS